MAKEKGGKRSARIVPLGDRVLVREITRDEAKTAGGILLPQSADAERDTKRGVVVAVGDGKLVDGKREPISVKVGQTVLYTWGDAITVDGEKYTLIRDGDIAAVLN
jgi:chaperonin GroES